MMDLEEWLESTEQLREHLLSFDKRPLPSDATERHQQLDESIQAMADAGRLHADANTFFLHERAAALMAVRKEYPSMNATERKWMVESRMADLERLIDGLAISKQTLKSRVFAIQNENRSSR